MKHLTKLKHSKRFEYMRKLGSQAVQNIAERIENAYSLFFENLKRKVRTSPPKFKAVRRYKSFTLKQAGWKLDEACGRIRLGKKMVRILFKSKCRKLSHKQKGSHHRERARLELARAYRRM